MPFFRTEKSFLIALFFFTILIHSRHALNADEGVVLSIAWNIFNGKVLYFDIFEFVAPGAFYLIFFVWKIFGVSYFAARYTAAIAIFLSAVGIVKISFEIEKSKSAFIIATFFVLSTGYWPIVSYHSFNLLFLIWSALYYIKSLKSQNMANPIISGVLNGVAILFMQHTGIYMFFSLIIFYLFIFFIKYNSSYLRKMLSFSIANILTISVLFFTWPPTLLFNNLVIFPLFNYEEVAKIPLTLIYLFLFALFVIAYTLWEKRKTELYFLFYIQTVLLISSASLADHFHVTKFLFPIYSLLPFFLSTLIRMPDKKIKLVYGLFFCLLSIYIVSQSFATIYKHLLSTGKYQREVIEKAKIFCSNSESIYAGPFIPNFYFELRKNNPSPHYWLITNHHTSEQFEEVLNGLKEFEPECIILNYSKVGKYHYNTDNPVDNYILSNYFFAESFGSFLFYKKMPKMKA